MDFTMYARFTALVNREGIEGAAKYVTDLGLTSVEFLALASNEDYNCVHSVAEAQQIREVLDRYHLPVACYSVAADLWNDPGAEEALKRHVEIAAELGSPFLHHTLIPWLELPEDAPQFGDVVERITAAAARIADHAKLYGITCIYEDQGYYFNGIANFKDFWERIRSRCENVGICGDLGNILFVNEMPEDFLSVFAKDVKHVHIKDYIWKKADDCPGKYWMPTKDGYWVRDTMIGSGIVDFNRCMKLLKEAGYQGRFAMELSHPEPFDAGIQQAKEYISRLWGA